MRSVVLLVALALALAPVAHAAVHRFDAVETIRMGSFKGPEKAGVEENAGGLGVHTSDVQDELERVHFSHAINYVPQLERRTRPKRDAHFMKPECPVGYTGAFCESPMCKTQASIDAPKQLRYALIDTIYMNSGCAGAYIVYIDTMLDEYAITVSTSDGTPYINLTDSAGRVWPSDASVYNDGVGMSAYRGLQAGIYQLTVTNAVKTASYCIATIEGRTLAMAAQMFVPDVFTDNSSYFEAAIDGVESFFVAHVFNLPQGADVRAVAIRVNNGVLPQYRALLNHRYGCQFEYFAGEYVCHRDNIYFYSIDGIDANGYKFRRSGTFACLENLHPALASL